MACSLLTSEPIIDLSSTADCSTSRNLHVGEDCGGAAVFGAQPAGVPRSLREPEGRRTRTEAPSGHHSVRPSGEGLGSGRGGTAIGPSSQAALLGSQANTALGGARASTTAGPPEDSSRTAGEERLLEGEARPAGARRVGRLPLPAPGSRIWSLCRILILKRREDAGRGKGKLGRSERVHGHIYTTKCKIDS